MRAASMLQHALLVGAIAMTAPALAAGLPELGTATELGRVLERLAIVAIAGLSMFYGFRLFAITTTDDGSLMARAGGWQIKLAKIGPGVFFAFFGAAIIIYALFKAPMVKSDATGTEVHGALPNVAGVSEDNRRRALTALNSIRKISEGSNPSLAVPERSQLASASAALESVQAALVDSIAGEGAYNQWRHLSDLQQAPDDSYADAMKDDAVSKRFNLVNQLMMQTTN
jgi:hypothetical protein